MSQRRDPSADGDLPRDERLLEALRHAPDHDVEPPAALSARILASARAATLQTTPAARTAKPWWAGALDALGPRTPWAAAFGTLAVAVLVGLLWSTRHDGEAPAPETQAADAASRRDSSPPPAAAAAPEARSNAAPAVAAAAPAAPPATAPVPAPVAAKPAAPTPAAPALAVAAAAPPARPATETAARERRAAPNEAAVAAKTEAAPAPRGAAVTAAPAPAAPSQASAEKPSAAAGAERRSEAADTAARPADRLAALTRSGDPIARLDAALAAQPEAVSWRHALRTHFHESPQRRWWSQLRDDTRGRWRAVQDTRRESVEPWVTVSVEGRRVATFWFEGEALWLRDEVGLWRVPATPAQQRAWQATLVTW